MKRVPLSILICTHNRPSQLNFCLKAIIDSSVIPKEIIIIDTSIPRINKTNENSIVYHRAKNPDIPIIFHYSSINLIPHSRNVLIKLSHQNLCLFIDDDVVVNKHTLEMIYQQHLAQPKAIIIGGICKPILPSNPYSIFSFRIFYGRYLSQRKTLIPVSFCPTMLLSFKKKYLRRQKIAFNEKLTTLEDIEFCHQIRKHYGRNSIYLNTHIRARHHYRSSFRDFITSFWKYFLSIRKLNALTSEDIFLVKQHENKLNIKQFLNQLKTVQLNSQNYLNRHENIFLSTIYLLLMIYAFKSSKITTSDN